MVRIHVFLAQHPDPVAFIEANEHGYRIDGVCAHLVDPHEEMLGLPSGQSVTAEDMPEEWARGLILRYRSPDLAARIVYDDEPLPEPVERVRGRVHTVG